MNQKELSELRRRFRPEKSAISHIYGCYVNSSREIVSYIDASLGTMPQEEVEKYLGLLKKTLSGQTGKNLIDIIFTTQQVADSPEHRRLTALRSTALKDREIREEFYQTVIQSLDMGESNYLILLAYDAYDVPHRGRDDVADQDASDQVFQYIICAVCPVKEGKPELGYFPGENEFHSCTAGQTVGAPELGFLFPAFDNRTANIYNALFYTRKSDTLHQELIDALFRVEAPMSADEQREAFHTALNEALGQSCTMEVVQAVHEQLYERIEAHREEKDPEPLVITPGDLSRMLERCGVEETACTAFQDKCGALFGTGAALQAANLIDSRRFEITAGDVKVSMDPASSYLVESRMVNGRKYLMIPVEADVEINGFPVGVAGEEQAAEGTRL